MKNLIIVTGIAFSLFTLSAGLAAQSDISDGSLEKSINEAKVLGPDYTVSVKIQGKEVIISTYLNTQSKNLEKDCKIDAVLLARKAFDLDKQLVRARILFYKFDRKSYQEVYVTTGDVKAYGAGQISNQELVDSLIVKEYAPGSETAVPGEQKATAESKSQPEPKEAISETSSKESKVEKPAAETKGSQKAAATIASTALSTAGIKKEAVKAAATSNPGCQAGELTFYYPRDWALKTNLRQDAEGEQRLAQLLCTAARDDATITVRTHQEDSPEKQMKDDVRFWQTHAYQPFSKKQLISFGRGSKYQGWDIGVYDREGGDRITFERHIYFWSPKRKIYSFELNCNKIEYQKLNSQFNYILSTAVFRAVK